MSTAKQSLWPSEIKPGIQIPFAILQQQAEALTKQTEGLLVGEVKVSHNEDRSVTHVALDMVVPLLDNYRHRVLSVTHRANLIYPAEVDAELFRRTASARLEVDPSGRTGRPNEAASDNQLLELVKKVLESVEVKALAISLIAKVTELMEQRQRQAETQNPQ